MYIQKTYRKGKNGKIYKSVSLMHNYRQGKKIKHRVISTLTNWPEDLISDFEKLLKGNKLETVESLKLSNGRSFGALKTVNDIAKRLGISQALGSGRQSKLALFQIAGRIISQGSRNYLANQWSKNQAVSDILKLSNISEDDLYENLDWLTKNQPKIEKKIFNYRYTNKKIKNIFLYDVTSSYTEGDKNELAEYGYNRDKKKGKKQIVIGLMLDSEGYPLTVEVFKGNTNDSKTVSSQLKKLKENFGIERVILVGDKGMIKSAQIEEIISQEYKWNYLTTITKSQIKTLLNNGVIQLSMFDDDIIEVKGENAERYILRKNKYRAEELRRNREAKIESLGRFIEKQNDYLLQHKRARVETALGKVEEKAEKLKLLKTIEIIISERQIRLVINSEKYAEESELDGCYVVKTDVPEKDLSVKEAHDRYKDLSKVEFAFRTMKTTMEEIRPIYVRKEQRTRGHVFVVMLAYMIIKYITDRIEEIGYTRRFAIESLDKIQYIRYEYKGQEIKQKPEKLSKEQAEILTSLEINL